MLLSRISLLTRRGKARSSCSRLLCSSSSDDEKPKKTSGKANNEAVNKLNTLLQQIVQDDQESKKKLSLARPKGRDISKKDGAKTPKTDTYEEKVVAAVKDVAGAIGGNTAQIESELLNILINGKKEPPSQNLQDIVKGMKIDRQNQEEKATSRAFQIRTAIQTKRSENVLPHKQQLRKGFSRSQTFDIDTAETVNIFGGKKLNIFRNVDVQTGSAIKINSTWDELAQRELKLAVTHPPANYFQEQILWTQQGKIWKFPIDNEQGMEEESSVYFADHVFLEEHLEPWCPAKGPLRHFMELVCVGLSKNPYMSVKDKREHIKWYQNYFESKRALLQEVGALTVDEGVQKQLESE